jgi:hypothetical protein
LLLQQGDGVLLLLSTPFFQLSLLELLLGYETDCVSLGLPVIRYLLSLSKNAL